MTGPRAVRNDLLERGNVPGHDRIGMELTVLVPLGLCHSASQLQVLEEQL